eukprot:g8117.t1
MPFGRKSHARTEPLVPESDPSRDGEESPRRGRFRFPSARRNFMDFPPQWRERQALMTFWSYYSIFTIWTVAIGFCGGVTGCIGSAFYTCNCCLPAKEEGGKLAAHLIYTFAFISFLLDLFATTVCTAWATYLLAGECTYSENICDLRTIFAIILLCLAGILLGRFIMGFNAFLSMRDYVRELQRERRLKERLEMETQARFMEYSKQQQRKKHRRDEEEV